MRILTKKDCPVCEKLKRSLPEEHEFVCWEELHQKGYDDFIYLWVADILTETAMTDKELTFPSILVPGKQFDILYNGIDVLRFFNVSTNDLECTDNCVIRR